MRTDVRVVLDTNVLVSAVLRASSPPGRCVVHILRHGKFLVSAAVLEEYAEVLMRAKLDAYVDRDLRTRILARIALEAEPVIVQCNVVACRDPRDNKFLEQGDAVDADANAVKLKPEVRARSHAGRFTRDAQGDSRTRTRASGRYTRCLQAPLRPLSLAVPARLEQGP